MTGHQLLAYSLLRQGCAEAAFDVLEALAQSSELRDDSRLGGPVLVAREPKRRARALEPLECLASRHVSADTHPS